MSDFFFKYLDKKNKENRKKSRFYFSLKVVVAFFLGSLIYSLVLYRIKDQLITIWNDGFIMMFFSTFGLIIPFIAICVAAYGVINSIINPKRDWKALLLYSVFIISFLSNKYYFQSVLGDYTVAFTVSFLVFIILFLKF